jgi:(1->4)-alpha-D-glucan 1-alpha-D-glucosylmutase
VKYTAPGIPDIYQGSELWDLHLVDPDNRAPVDYQVRRSMLTELEAGMSVEEILKRTESGLPKLWIIYRALELRKRHPEWFGASAAYTPLHAEGAKKDHAVAYLRGENVATLVPRWSLKLGSSWSSTTLDLPQGSWRNLLTGDLFSGGRTRVQDVLQRFPVALLTKEED